jgi:hypothetical protein
MPNPVLSYSTLHAALVKRLVQDDKISEGRDEYVGASEVGGCPRLVSFRKGARLGWDPDHESAGVMLPGRLAEIEGIEFLRLSGFDDLALRATGTEQADLRDGYLHAHPDGLLTAGMFDLDPASAYFKADGSKWDFNDLKALLVGDGILEFKSGSSSVFREAVKRGINPTYQDQIQSNMGLSARKWTLLFFICRDNFSKMALFFVPFNETRFLELRRHADAIMASASLIRAEIGSSGVTIENKDDASVASALVAEHLLEADPDRGYCGKCPIRHNCPAVSRAMGEGTFPETILDEVEAWVLIAVEQSDIEKAAKEMADDAKDRIKELGKQYNASKATFYGEIKSIALGSQKGRETCNFTKMKTDFPEAYAACCDRGEDFATLRFNRKKG